MRSAKSWTQEPEFQRNIYLNLKLSAGKIFTWSLMILLTDSIWHCVYNLIAPTTIYESFPDEVSGNVFKQGSNHL